MMHAPGLFGLPDHPARLSGQGTRLRRWSVMWTLRLSELF